MKLTYRQILNAITEINGNPQAKTNGLLDYEDFPAETVAWLVRTARLLEGHIKDWQKAVQKLKDRFGEDEDKAQEEFDKLLDETVKIADLTAHKAEKFPGVAARKLLGLGELVA